MDNETGVVEETRQEVAAPVIEAEETQETGVTPSEDGTASPAEGSEEPIQEAGQIAAIQAERERRQNAESRNQILEEELRQIRSQTQQQSPKDPFDGLADDDIVQVGTVKQYLKSFEDKFSGEFQRQRIATSTRTAQGKYEDYAEVVGKLPNIANESQIRLILSSDDPAEMAYRFVKSSPEYESTITQRAKQQGSQQVIDSMNQHLKKPNTLSKVGGGKRDTATFIQGLDDKQFNELENAVKHGNQKILKKYGF